MPKIKSNYCSAEWFSDLVSLLGYISIRRKYSFLSLIGMMVLSAMLEMISIGSIFPFINALVSPDTILSNSNFEALANILHAENQSQLIFKLGILLSIALVLACLARVTLVVFQTRLGFDIAGEICSDGYRRTLHQPYEAHLNSNTSETISCIVVKAAGIANSIVIPILSSISSFIIIIGISGLLIWQEPEIILLVVTIFGFIYYLISRVNSSYIFNNGLTISRLQTVSIKNIQEGLGGIRDVLLDDAQEYYATIYENTDKKLRRSLGNINIASLLPRYIIETFAMLLVVAVAIMFSQTGKNLDSPLPLLGMFALSAQRIMPLLQNLYSSWTSIRGSQKNTEDVLNLLKLPLNDQKCGITKQIAFNSEISVRNLDFCYSEMKKNPVLRGLSITIQKGDVLGIVGSTGSGKSTFVDILMGLLKPTSGSIFVDNVVLDESNLKSWKRKIAHVPQRIFLADTTVLCNIAFGVASSQIDVQRAMEAAKIAQIHSDIESMELGYQTIVGELGQRLSGGQRQRIGIARALYKNPELLVLDEATSALDGQTEMELVDEISKKCTSVTIIMIAHRLTSLKNCNKILKINAGTLEQIDVGRN